MTREEFGRIVKVMKAIYTSEKFIPDKDAFDAWYFMLGEYDYNSASLATKTYMATEKFPPTPADIIDKIHSAKEMPSEISESAVWAQVMKALGNSTYNSVSEFEKLDEVAKRVIGSPESLRTMAMNSEFNEDVEKALFMKTYRAQMTRQKEINRMPSDVRNAIGIGNNNNIGGYIG